MTLEELEQLGNTYKVQIVATNRESDDGSWTVTAYDRLSTMTRAISVERPLLDDAATVLRVILKSVYAPTAEAKS